jgi:catechol 2,3-dioxygenase-like lactoylglutathione lyase family enzyme
MKTNLFLVSILTLAASTGANAQQNFDKITMTIMAVGNMDKSKEFYTQDLGFKTTKDYSQGGQRWVNIVPPGGGTSITLSTYFGSTRPGTMQLYLSTADIQAAHDDLAAKGVIVSKISDDLYGPGSGVKWFSLSDPDGNHWIVWQEPKR